MHIYILPQCSTTAASVLNSAGMDAQFERSCCAISRGILNQGSNIIQMSLVILDLGENKMLVHTILLLTAVVSTV